MKSKEELDALKEEVENINNKHQELTPEELEQVSGGRPELKMGITIMGKIIAVDNLN